MISTTQGIGVVDVGEGYVILKPKNYVDVGTKMGVIFLHGAGGYASDAFTFPGILPTLQALVLKGHTVLSIDASGGNWSNNVAMDKINNAHAYLTTALGARTGKVGLMGVSMGGGNVLTWAAANPTKTACVMGIIPVVDIQDMYANRGAGGSIDGAYAGGWSQTVYGPHHNPVTLAQAGKYAGIPIRTYYGLSDTTCVPSTQIAFRDASGAVATSFAGGHTVPLSPMPWDVNEVATWFASFDPGTPPTGVPFGRDSAKWDAVNSIYNLTTTTSVPIRTRIGRGLGAGVGTAHIECFLDSITAGAGADGHVGAWPTLINQKFSALNGYVGTGIIPLHDPIGTDPRVTLSAGVVAVNDWGPYGFGALRMDATTQSIRLAPTVCDSVTLWLLRTEARGEVFVGATSQGFFDCTEPRGDVLYTIKATPTQWPGVVKVEFPFTGAISREIILKPTVNGQNIFVVGMETKVNSTRSIRVSNSARGGAQMAQVVTDDQTMGYRGMAQTLDIWRPDIAIIMAGINDFQNHVPLGTFRARMITFLNRQVANGGTTILVAPPRPNFDHIPGDHILTPPLDAYISVLYDMADAYNIPLVDIAHKWTDYATAAAKGWYADYVHPNRAGHAAMANAIYEAVRY